MNIFLVPYDTLRSNTQTRHPTDGNTDSKTDATKTDAKTEILQARQAVRRQKSEGSGDALGA